MIWFETSFKTETVLRTNKPGQLPTSLLRAVSLRVPAGGAAEGGGRRYRAACRAAPSRRWTDGRNGRTVGQTDKRTNARVHSQAT